MALPVFKITDAGIAAANAHSGGPAIFISQFKIGSGFNYEPDGTESDIQGTELYNGVPTSLNLVSNQVLDVVVQIPANVGPFNFGEIALFLDDGTMFAIATYEVPQEKLQQVVSGVANVWVIHCLLHLSPTPDVSFSLNNNSGVILPEVPHTGYVTGPIQMMNDPNAVIVHEATPGSESLLLIKHADAEWTPVEYYFWKSGTVTAATFDTVSANIFKGIGNYTANSLLVQDEHGNLRGVDKIKGGGKIDYSHASIQLNVGDTIKVYKYDALKSMGIDFTEGNPEVGDVVITTPTVVSPANGSSNASRTSLAVTSSAYSTAPPGAEAHSKTRWQVRTSAGIVVYDQQFNSPSLTSATLNLTQNLAIATAYTLRVKYISDEGTESAWSPDSTFTTGGGTVVAINPPTVDATGTKTTSFSINASPNPMTVSGGTDTHAQTEFRISTAPNGTAPYIPNILSNNYSGHVVGLFGGTTYYASARYRGLNLGWSAWGPDAVFTTEGGGGGGTSTAYVDPPVLSADLPLTSVNPANGFPITCTNVSTAVHNSTATISQVTFYFYQNGNLVGTSSTSASPPPSTIPGGSFQLGSTYTIRAKYFTTQGGLMSDFSDPITITTAGATSSYNPIIHSHKTTYTQGETVWFWITGAPPGPCTTSSSVIPGYAGQTFTIAPDGTYGSEASPMLGDWTSGLQPNSPATIPSYSYDWHFTGSGQDIKRTAGYFLKHASIISITTDKQVYEPGQIVTFTFKFSPECADEGGLASSPLWDTYNIVNFPEVVATNDITDNDPTRWNRATATLTTYARLAIVPSTQTASATFRDRNGHVFTITVTINVPQASGSKTFYTSGTWTVPAGVTKIRAAGCAGGGGGGAGDAVNGGPFGSPMGGGGGGGGENYTGFEFAVSPGDTLNLTVGAGGQGGLYDGFNYGTSGTDGGNSSITLNGNLIASLSGGKGGQGGKGVAFVGNVGGAPGGPTGLPTPPTAGGSVPFGGKVGGTTGIPNGGRGGDAGKAGQIGAYCRGGDGFMKVEW